jgi:hypothetical protein
MLLVEPRLERAERGITLEAEERFNRMPFDLPRQYDARLDRFAV